MEELIKENNKLLKEIHSMLLYVLQQDDTLKAFAVNLAANLFVKK